MALIRPNLPSSGEQEFNDIERLLEQLKAKHPNRFSLFRDQQNPNRIVLQTVVEGKLRELTFENRSGIPVINNYAILGSVSVADPQNPTSSWQRVRAFIQNTAQAIEDPRVERPAESFVSALQRFVQSEIYIGTTPIASPAYAAKLSQGVHVQGVKSALDFAALPGGFRAQHYVLPGDEKSLLGQESVTAVNVSSVLATLGVWETPQGEISLPTSPGKFAKVQRLGRSNQAMIPRSTLPTELRVRAPGAMQGDVGAVRNVTFLGSTFPMPVGQIEISPRRQLDYWMMMRPTELHLSQQDIYAGRLLDLLRAPQTAAREAIRLFFGRQSDPVTLDPKSWDRIRIETVRIQLPAHLRNDPLVQKQIEQALAEAKQNTDRSKATIANLLLNNPEIIEYVTTPGVSHARISFETILQRREGFFHPVQWKSGAAGFKGVGTTGYNIGVFERAAQAAGHLFQPDILASVEGIKASGPLIANIVDIGLRQLREGSVVTEAHKHLLQGKENAPKPVRREFGSALADFIEKISGIKRDPAGYIVLDEKNWEAVQKAAGYLYAFPSAPSVSNIPKEMMQPLREAWKQAGGSGRISVNALLKAIREVTGWGYRRIGTGEEYVPIGTVSIETGDLMSAIAIPYLPTERKELEKIIASNFGDVGITSRRKAVEQLWKAVSQERARISQNLPQFVIPKDVPEEELSEIQKRVLAYQRAIHGQRYVPGSLRYNLSVPKERTTVLTAIHEGKEYDIAYFHGNIFRETSRPISRLTPEVLSILPPTYEEFLAAFGVASEPYNPLSREQVAERIYQAIQEYEAVRTQHLPQLPAAGSLYKENVEQIRITSGGVIEARLKNIESLTAPTLVNYRPSFSVSKETLSLQALSFLSNVSPTFAKEIVQRSFGGASVRTRSYWEMLYSHSNWGIAGMKVVNIDDLDLSQVEKLATEIAEQKTGQKGTIPSDRHYLAALHNLLFEQVGTARVMLRTRHGFVLPSPRAMAFHLKEDPITGEPVRTLTTRYLNLIKAHIGAVTPAQMSAYESLFRISQQRWLYDPAGNLYEGVRAGLSNLVPGGKFGGVIQEASFLEPGEIMLGYEKLREAYRSAIHGNVFKGGKPPSFSEFIRLAHQGKLFTASIRYPTTQAAQMGVFRIVTPEYLSARGRLPENVAKTMSTLKSLPRSAFYVSEHFAAQMTADMDADIAIGVLATMYRSVLKQNDKPVFRIVQKGEKTKLLPTMTWDVSPEIIGDWRRSRMSQTSDWIRHRHPQTASDVSSPIVLMAAGKQSEVYKRLADFGKDIVTKAFSMRKTIAPEDIANAISEEAMGKMGMGIAYGRSIEFPTLMRVIQNVPSLAPEELVQLQNALGEYFQDVVDYTKSPWEPLMRAWNATLSLAQGATGTATGDVPGQDFRLSVILKEQPSDYVLTETGGKVVSGEWQPGATEFLDVYIPQMLLQLARSGIAPETLEMLFRYTGDPNKYNQKLYEVLQNEKATPLDVQKALGLAGPEGYRNYQRLLEESYFGQVLALNRVQAWADKWTKAYGTAPFPPLLQRLHQRFAALGQAIPFWRGTTRMGKSHHPTEMLQTLSAYPIPGISEFARFFEPVRMFKPTGSAEYEHLLESAKTLAQHYQAMSAEQGRPFHIPREYGIRASMINRPFGDIFAEHFLSWSWRSALTAENLRRAGLPENKIEQLRSIYGEAIFGRDVALATHVGNVWHALLENYFSRYSRQYPSLVMSEQPLALPEYGLTARLDTALNVKAILENPDAPPELKQMAESLRAKMKPEQEWAILDLKTSIDDKTDPERHQRQMAQYAPQQVVYRHALARHLNIEPEKIASFISLEAHKQLPELHERIKAATGELIARGELSGDALINAVLETLTPDDAINVAEKVVATARGLTDVIHSGGNQIDLVKSVFGDPETGKPGMLDVYLATQYGLETRVPDIPRQAYTEASWQQAMASGQHLSELAKLAETMLSNPVAEAAQSLVGIYRLADFYGYRLQPPQTPSSTLTPQVLATAGTQAATLAATTPAIAPLPQTLDPANLRTRALQNVLRRPSKPSRFAPATGGSGGGTPPPPAPPGAPPSPPPPPSSSGGGGKPISDADLITLVNRVVDAVVRKRYQIAQELKGEDLAGRYATNILDAPQVLQEQFGTFQAQWSNFSQRMLEAAEAPIPTNIRPENLSRLAKRTRATLRTYKTYEDLVGSWKLASEGLSQRLGREYNVALEKVRAGLGLSSASTITLQQVIEYGQKQNEPDIVKVAQAYELAETLRAQLGVLSQEMRQQYGVATEKLKMKGAALGDIIAGISESDMKSVEMLFGPRVSPKLAQTIVETMNAGGLSTGQLTSLLEEIRNVPWSVMPGHSARREQLRTFQRRYRALKAGYERYFETLETTGGAVESFRFIGETLGSKEYLQVAKTLESVQKRLTHEGKGIDYDEVRAHLASIENALIHANILVSGAPTQKPEVTIRSAQKVFAELFGAPGGYGEANLASVEQTISEFIGRSAQQAAVFAQTPWQDIAKRLATERQAPHAPSAQQIRRQARGRLTALRGWRQDYTRHVQALQGAIAFEEEAYAKASQAGSGTGAQHLQRAERYRALLARLEKEVSPTLAEHIQGARAVRAEATLFDVAVGDMPKPQQPPFSSMATGLRDFMLLYGTGVERASVSDVESQTRAYIGETRGLLQTLGAQPEAWRGLTTALEQAIRDPSSADAGELQKQAKTRVQAFRNIQREYYRRQQAFRAAEAYYETRDPAMATLYQVMRSRLETDIGSTISGIAPFVGTVQTQAERLGLLQSLMPKPPETQSNEAERRLYASMGGFVGAYDKLSAQLIAAAEPFQDALKNLADEMERLKNNVEPASDAFAVLQKQAQVHLGAYKNFVRMTEDLRGAVMQWGQEIAERQRTGAPLPPGIEQRYQDAVTRLQEAERIAAGAAPFAAELTTGLAVLGMRDAVAETAAQNVLARLRRRVGQGPDTRIFGGGLGALGFGLFNLHRVHSWTFGQLRQWGADYAEVMALQQQIDWAARGGGGDVLIPQSVFDVRRIASSGAWLRYTLGQAYAQGVGGIYSRIGTGMANMPSMAAGIITDLMAIIHPLLVGQIGMSVAGWLTGANLGQFGPIQLLTRAAMAHPGAAAVVGIGGLLTLGARQALNTANRALDPDTWTWFERLAGGVRSTLYPEQHITHLRELYERTTQTWLGQRPVISWYLQTEQRRWQAAQIVEEYKRQQQLPRAELFRQYGYSPAEAKQVENILTQMFGRSLTDEELIPFLEADINYPGGLSAYLEQFQRTARHLGQLPGTPGYEATMRAFSGFPANIQAQRETIAEMSRPYFELFAYSPERRQELIEQYRTQLVAENMTADQLETLIRRQYGFSTILEQLGLPGGIPYQGLLGKRLNELVERKQSPFYEQMIATIAGMGRAFMGQFNLGAPTYEMAERWGRRLLPLVQRLGSIEAAMSELASQEGYYGFGRSITFDQRLASRLDYFYRGQDVFGRERLDAMRSTLNNLGLGQQTEQLFGMLASQPDLNFSLSLRSLGELSNLYALPGTQASVKANIRQLAPLAASGRYTPWAMQNIVQALAPTSPYAWSLPILVPELWRLLPSGDPRRMLSVSPLTNLLGMQYGIYEPWTYQEIAYRPLAEYQLAQQLLGIDMNIAQSAMSVTRMRHQLQDIRAQYGPGGFGERDLALRRRQLDMGSWFQFAQLALRGRELALGIEEYRYQRQYRLGEMEAQRAMQLRQREWTTEDYARQLERFGVQTGWQEEDFRRAIRFSTGRQRLDLMRQLRRFTVQTEWQRGDLNREQQRREEVWRYEDERYRKQLEYERQINNFQEERFALQAEGLELARKEAEARHQLGLEMMGLDEERFKHQQKQAAEEAKHIQEMLALEQKRLALLRDWQETEKKHLEMITRNMMTFAQYVAQTLSQALRGVEPQTPPAVNWEEEQETPHNQRFAENPISAPNPFSQPVKRYGQIVSPLPYRESAPNNATQLMSSTLNTNAQVIINLHVGAETLGQAQFFVDLHRALHELDARL